jgi:hypothetical protein
MKKIFVSILLTLALLTFATGTVFAQETSVSGTVESVEFGTDANGETIVILTISGQTEPMQISLATAESLGLVTTDPNTGESSITDTAVGSDVTIEEADIIPSDGEGEEESEHPVGSALSEFFSDLLGVDYDTIMEQHEDGFGFGVIAQALWLTNQIDGDTETFVALLEAKESGDYSNIVLADGSTPNNWGDVVRSLRQGENLGSVMSNNAGNGQANSDDEEGNGNGRGLGNDNENNLQGLGGNRGNGPGNGNGNGNGNGPANGPWSGNDGPWNNGNGPWNNGQGNGGGDD